jgi:hypothetical protein
MTIARGYATRDPRRPARLLQTNRQQFHPGSGHRAALAHHRRAWIAVRWHGNAGRLRQDPRHGVGRGRLDPSARIIAILERLGLAHDVRWPTARRLARLAATPDRQG